MKILVTGSNGYIGAHLGNALIAKGFQVILSDLQSLSIIRHPDYFQEDLVNPKILHELVKDVDLIFFCTGKTGTEKEGFNSPSEFVLGNELTLVNLLEKLVKTSSRARVIFPSSRLLYKGCSGVKLREDSELNVKTVYAINKLACEKYLEAYNKCFGIDYTIFRISLPYGSLLELNRLSYGVLSFLVSRAKNGGDLKVYGDGTQKRSLIHIEDLIEVLILGALSPKAKNKIFNIGGPDIMEMGNIICSIAQHFKVPCSQIPWPDVSLLVESGDTILDSSRIDAILNYKYKHSFFEWLNKQKVTSQN